MESNYQKLVVWKKSFELSKSVYKSTKDFPKSEFFGLVSQMRRCSISIPSNIAEGAGRSSKKEFSHFLSIARGSCNELETQVLMAAELGYLNIETKKALLGNCVEILKMLSVLIQKVSKS